MWVWPSGGSCPGHAWVSRRVRSLLPPETVWEGLLKAGAGLELRIVLHVVNPEKGPPRATFDSPDQGAKGLKVDTITVKPDSLSFSMQARAGRVHGQL